MSIRVEHGDMRMVLGKMVAEGQTIHAVVTDPPYHLTNNIGSRSPNPGQYTPIGKPKQPKGGFMGKAWDGGDIAFQPGTWRLCFDLLPPGGHLLAFAGTRTYHRMAVAIEEAGFEIRDTISWLYGSGFPKSHNVSKGIDRAAGAEREVVGKEANYGTTKLADGKNAFGDYAGEWDVTRAATEVARQWEGWGTALKPAMELICVARKPLVGTVAANVLKHGTGALNIDGCRIGTEGGTRGATMGPLDGDPDVIFDNRLNGEFGIPVNGLGRWPANVCHDGSNEVVSAFPDTQSGQPLNRMHTDPGRNVASGAGLNGGGQYMHSGFGDAGNASRFFYSAKADAGDRLGSRHPTIKPVDLMRWLVRLITPPGGTVLDPFAGSGTTGMACMAEGIDCILVEREAEYVADIKARIAHVRGDDTPLFAMVAE